MLVLLLLLQLCLSRKIRLTDYAMSLEERVVVVFELIIAGLDVLEPVRCCRHALRLSIPLLAWESVFRWNPGHGYVQV